LHPAGFLLCIRRTRGERSVDYLAPFETIKSLLSFAAVNGELTVTASYAQFTAVVRSLLLCIEVDEAWYINQYPDVADAIRDGAIMSAKEHFLHNGYFEGRMPFPIAVDEAWYLEQNPGVAEHIASGELLSAQQHFEDNGYREGRRPRP
jgi:hypothetical protein